MMRRRVGVLERNAVEGDCVLAVLKSAEERFALTQTNSVRIEAKSDAGEMKF
jgi:hypothetical protein